MIVHLIGGLYIGGFVAAPFALLACAWRELR